jgi:hypothetical protein
VTIDKSLEPLPKSNLVQIAMDGPNVNLKFLELFKEDRTRSEEPSEIVDLGTCNLHNIHNAFKVGARATDWEVQKVLKAAYYTLHDTPARREDFILKTQCTDFPMFFCGTR